MMLVFWEERGTSLKQGIRIIIRIGGIAIRTTLKIGLTTIRIGGTATHGGRENTSIFLSHPRKKIMCA